MWPLTDAIQEEGAMEIHEDVDLDDRGHGNIKPGYRRRQVPNLLSRPLTLAQLQFFMYKIYSQTVSFLFYLIVAPILRSGPNFEYYPLSAAATSLESSLNTLDDDSYRDSLIYAAFGVVTAALTAVIAYRYVGKPTPNLSQP